MDGWMEMEKVSVDMTNNKNIKDDNKTKNRCTKFSIDIGGPDILFYIYFFYLFL